MIAATFSHEESFGIREMPIPGISDGEVLLRVEATSICGTDLKISRLGHRKIAKGQRIVLGHEFAGVIEKSRSTLCAEGIRVGVAPNWGCGKCEACIRGLANYCSTYTAFGINQDGAHAEYVRVPSAAIAQGNLTPLAPAISWEMASLVEPLSCVVSAQKTIPVRQGDTVLVYGCGPMGLLHILLARTSGAGEIIAIDPNENRLEVAQRIGATATIHARGPGIRGRVMDLTSGAGADVVITAAPIAGIVSEALAILSTFGRLCLFAGLPKDAPEVTLDGNAIHYRNLSVSGATGGCNADYRLALRLIESGRVPIAEIVSHRYSLSSMKDAYEAAASRGAMKVVLLREEK